MPESTQCCLLVDRLCLPKISKPIFTLAITGLISSAKVMLHNWKCKVRPEYRGWVNLMTELLIVYHKESYLLVWKQREHAVGVRHCTFEEYLTFGYILSH